MEFLGLLLNARLGTWNYAPDRRIIAALMNRRAITHRSVRPNVENYDTQYYSNNLERCLS